MPPKRLSKRARSSSPNRSLPLEDLPGVKRHPTLLRQTRPLGLRSQLLLRNPDIFTQAAADRARFQQEKESQSSDMYSNSGVETNSAMQEAEQEEFGVETETERETKAKKAVGKMDKRLEARREDIKRRLGEMLELVEGARFLSRESERVVRHLENAEYSIRKVVGGEIGAQGEDGKNKKVEQRKRRFKMEGEGQGEDGGAVEGGLVYLTSKANSMQGVLRKKK